MTTNHTHRIDNTIWNVILGGTAELYAECDTAEQAAAATDLLERAAKAQNARQYTTSARFYRRAEAVPSFRYVESADA